MRLFHALIGPGRTAIGWPRLSLLLVLTLTFCLAAMDARAQPAGLVLVKTPHSFATLEERVAAAIKSAGMLRVFKASASRAAKARGVDIPGDSVYGVFRNDFAVRMIRANPLAGTEAPILIHVMEQQDGTAALAYKTPSSVFEPYAVAGAGAEGLTTLAAELDAIFDAIVRQAAAP